MNKKYGNSVYAWEDGTTDDLVFPFTIGKANFGSKNLGTFNLAFLLYLQYNTLFSEIKDRFS